MDNDIFDIDLLEKGSSSNKLADNLNSESENKVNELRVKLFNSIYENVLKCIQNNHKYLKKCYCIYTIPQSYNGVVLYKELRRSFMKFIIIRLHKENFKIDLVNKDTIMIKW